MVDERDFVTCKLCGEKFRTRLYYHLKNDHGITTKEYKMIFEGSRTISENEYTRCLIKNKSDKMRRVISDRNRDPEFQKKCQEGCTESTRAAQAENMRKVSKRMWQDPEYRARHVEIARETQKRENSKPEVRERKSEISHKLWMDPEYAAKATEAPKKHPYGVQSRIYLTKFEKEFYCRSQGEREFLELVADLDYVIGIESGTALPIEYLNEDSVCKVYIPDFIVRTYEQLYVVEVKYEDDPIDGHKYKVNGAVDYCESRGMKFCYVLRFSGIKSIRDNGFESVVISRRI